MAILFLCPSVSLDNNIIRLPLSSGRHIISVFLYQTWQNSDGSLSLGMLNTSGA